jgi:hypothetical protein
VSDPLHSLNASPLHADWSAADGLKPANAALGNVKRAKPRAAITAFLIVIMFFLHGAFDAVNYVARPEKRRDGDHKKYALSKTRWPEQRADASTSPCRHRCSLAPTR